VELEDRRAKKKLNIEGRHKSPLQWRRVGNRERQTQEGPRKGGELEKSKLGVSRLRRSVSARWVPSPGGLG
jgi:hypothetical protein